MLIGCMIYIINPRMPRMTFRCVDDEWFIFHCRHEAVCTASPNPPCVALCLKKKSAQQWVWYPHAHPFFFPSLLILCHPVFKKQLTDAPSAGAPFHHMLNPLLAIFFSFISLTISQESWWHYAICCNTITSLSHFSVVVKAGTVSSNTVLQQIQIPPHTREARCDFLPLPDNPVTLGLVGHL